MCNKNAPSHGSKSKHSTLTAGLHIQSLIAWAVDGDIDTLMASLDLSAAIDFVNIGLLLKHLTIFSLPRDVIKMIDIWLLGHYFYVSLDGVNSYVHGLSVGMVQGFILGPILFSLFVSPLLDLAKITLFADDNYLLVWNTLYCMNKAFKSNQTWANPIKTRSFFLRHSEMPLKNTSRKYFVKLLLVV